MLLGEIAGEDEDGHDESFASGLKDKGEEARHEILAEHHSSHDRECKLRNSRRG